MWNNSLVWWSFSILNAICDVLKAEGVFFEDHTKEHHPVTYPLSPFQKPMNGPSHLQLEFTSLVIDNN